MRLHRVHWTVAVAVWAAMALGITNHASAAFVSQFTGNSSISGSHTGFASFAVYQNIGATGNWLQDLGLGSVAVLQDGPAIDTGADFVYFYQLSNTIGLEIAEFRIPLDPATAAPTSSGHLSSTVFEDEQGDVGPVTNPFLGPAPNTTGVADPGFSSGPQPGLRNPTGTQNLNADNEMVIEFQGLDAIAATEFSSVAFFTSNAPLTTFVSATAESGLGLQSSANVPAPHIPEPGSLVLLGLGLTVMGGGAAMRKRRQQRGAAGSPVPSNSPQTAA